jgi:hypothetical protein
MNQMLDHELAAPGHIKNYWNRSCCEEHICKELEDYMDDVCFFDIDEGIGDIRVLAEGYLRGWLY